MKLKLPIFGLLTCALMNAQSSTPMLSQSTLTANILAIGQGPVSISSPFPFIPSAPLNQGVIYAESEAMLVLSANLALNQLVVQRGYLGTTATTHNAGVLVFSGQPFQFISTDKSGSCDPNSPQYLNVTDQLYFTCNGGSWVSATTTNGGGSGGGTVTSVTATAPLTGGTIHTAGSIGCQVASASQAGCLSAADYSTFTGKQAAGNYPIGAGSTTSGFLPTWTSSTGGSLGAGLGITGTATKVVTAPAAGTSGNCAQWLTGNLVDSGSACGSGGGSVTWPATGDLVLSNSTSSPAGLAPVNGDCVIGSGGAWTAGSCSGSGGTTATAIQSGVLASRPSTCTIGAVYWATDQPALQQFYGCSATNVWTQQINIGSGGLSITSGTLDVDHSIIGCLACANLWTANQAEALGAKWMSTHGTVTQASGTAAITSGTSGAIATSSIAALATPGTAGDWVQLSNQNCTGILGYSIVAATSVTITDSVTESCSVHWEIHHDN